MMKTSLRRKGAATLAGIFLLVTLGSFATVACAGSRIDNPYAGASWDVAHQQKANFHTHTKVSDGHMYPHEAIDAYRDLGYAILAITDHDKVTYPWSSLKEDRGESFENRAPKTVGMKDIQGNEFSSHHHICSLFSDQEGTKTETESLDGVTKKGGLAFMNHPGRYKKPVSWYTDLYARYDVLVGLEIYNQGDRYPKDREKWDEILSVTMPDRPVWGVSNDDMHKKQHLGRNWNVLLIDEATEPKIRTSLKQGSFYFVYAPKGHGGAVPPMITGIDLAQKNGTIAITAKNTDTIEWISGGEVVAKGNVFKLADATGVGSYVRAMLYGAEGSIAGTQPFGIHK